MFQDNLATGTAMGFYAAPGLSGDCDQCNDEKGAGDVTLLHNVATNGGVGFFLPANGSRHPKRRLEQQSVRLCIGESRSVLAATPRSVTQAPASSSLSSLKIGRPLPKP